MLDDAIRVGSHSITDVVAVVVAIPGHSGAVVGDVVHFHILGNRAAFEGGEGDDSGLKAQTVKFAAVALNLNFVCGLRSEVGNGDSGFGSGDGLLFASFVRCSADHIVDMEVVVTTSVCHVCWIRRFTIESNLHVLAVVG